MRKTFVIILLLSTIHVVYGQKRYDASFGYSMCFTYNVLKLNQITHDTLSSVNAFSNPGFGAALNYYIPLSAYVTLRIDPGFYFTKNTLLYKFKNTSTSIKDDYAALTLPLNMLYSPMKQRGVNLLGFVGANYLPLHENIVYKRYSGFCGVGIGNVFRLSAVSISVELKYAYNFSNYYRSNKLFKNQYITRLHQDMFECCMCIF